MLDREFRAALLQFGSVIALLAVMPLVFLLDSSFYRTGVLLEEYLIGGYSLLWIVGALYLAYNMFRGEEQDGAKEYLLSLPVGRGRLLLLKTIPRMAVLLTAALIEGMLGTHQFVGTGMLIAFIVFSQVCGFILGIVGRRSLSARLILFTMVVFVYIINSTPPRFMLYDILLLRSSVPYLLLETSLLTLILMPVYRDWDLKPMAARESRLAKLSIGPLLILAFPVVHLFSSS
jgi:ABC-type transport system involved in multi-copper enzyme maturation permease subunit